ncbi:SMI1/KNR4 family protein [Deinococcus sp. YIM 134068]|uniref:SMI1/KNR4 family protein n=1 Tax=Deinococcus lichenicola TaxID=3118910 RepID=UPI002F95B5E3
MTEDELIMATRDRLAGPPSPIWEARDPRPPVTAEEWSTFEAAVGLPLPPLLRRVYMEIGDGGWGPWAGLCPLGVRGDEDEPWFSVLGQWEGGIEARDAVEAEDESYLLYFCNGGCVVFSVFDTTTGRVGLRDGEEPILWQADSLHDWFERWLVGEHVMSFGNPA